MLAYIDTTKCEGCGDCVDECPTLAITIVDEKATVNEEDCAGCGACEGVCPMQAIKVE